MRSDEIALGILDVNAEELLDIDRYQSECVLLGDFPTTLEGGLYHFESQCLQDKATTYPSGIPSGVARLPRLLDADPDSNVVIDQRLDSTRLRQG